jgi:acetyl-CoA carboxylase biotin carboxyl carrier protein
MIDLEFVESLIRALDKSSLDSLELERGGTRIRLSKSPTSVALPEPRVQLESSNRNGLPPVTSPPLPADDSPPSPPAEPMERVTAEEEGGALIEVTSPMVGTFYRAPSPEAPPYVEVGARVGRGSVLCIIEAMKLMNELESEVEGTIANVLVENAQPVEYGQTLFLIDPS